MKRRALIGALSIVFLAPLASAWCPQCVVGACSMGAPAEPASPASAEVSCHPAPCASPLAVLAAEGDCCGMSMGSMASSAGAPIEAVYFDFHLQPLPGDGSPFAPQVTLRLDEPLPELRPPGTSTPLFTLHSSLLL